MDQQKLRTLVFEKTGVRIDVDDPVFALVALNEAVLAEAVERHVALLDEATRQLEARVDALHGGAARPVQAGSALPAPAAERRIIAIAGGAAALGALLVLLGQAAFFKPAPPAAPVVQAKELTPEQTKALADFDKMSRAVGKLDAKARRQVEAEMRKPD